MNKLVAALTFLLDTPVPGDLPVVGGQAVMGGVLMRNGGVSSLAVRRPSGEITIERKGWRTMGSKRLHSIRFVRGFPILVETLSNGIRALNRSAELSADDAEKPMTGFQVAGTLMLALGMVVLLFVAAPHFLAYGMEALGMGGGMKSLTFHIWDGIFKFVIFLAYLAGISLLPDIRSVFQYHGAEHKSIHAFEQPGNVTIEKARAASRLHPRCGTTFMLFVLCAAILLHAVLVPALLLVWDPGAAWIRHFGVLLFKVALIVPVSALAYELIRASASMSDGIVRRILRGPGLLLQFLTTREPGDEHLEVALAALRSSLGEDSPWIGRFEISSHDILE